MIDVSGLKGRIGEAFVENILRRAGYRVARVGRESQIHRLVKIGTDEFLPDFLIWKPAEHGPAGERLHRLMTVEVKYRANIPEWLRWFDRERLAAVAGQWPEHYLVFVTDNPQDRRSCFQVIDLRDYAPGRALVTKDLHEARELDIFQKTVEEYESLVKRMFSLLSVHGTVEDLEPKAELKLNGRLPPAEPEPVAPVIPGA
ncbi:MAG TPA: hypothetical protein VFN71_11090 [Methylomirabilota bacterium]|nr:hypothetical protein [Methylomirabilota bacterium]